MTYRLGEFECPECGHRALAGAVSSEDKLPVQRRDNPQTPGYRPSGYVDTRVQRGTRHH
jgi:hypothetical protein